MSTPAWQPDPTGRHQYRWWDGEQWTHHVANDGIANSDPATGLDTLPAPAGSEVPGTSQSHLIGRKADLGDGRTVTLASPGARLGAWLIDGVVIGIISAPLSIPFLSTDTQEDEYEGWRDIWSDLWRDIWSGFAGSLLPSTAEEWIFYLLFFLVSLVYGVVFIATKGQTLGKMAAGVRVVGIEDGSIPGFGKALRRWAIPGLLAIIPIVGLLLSYICYLSLTWRRDRQGWHDSLAGTMVVKVDRAVSQNARWARTHDLRPVLLASTGARVGARLIDFLIMMIFWAVLLIPTVITFLALDIEGSLWALVWFFGLPALFVGLLYEVTMISARGQTLGKMATGIKVIRADTGRKPGTAKSLARWALPGLLLLIPLIGWLISFLCYLSLTWGSDRQGWHDKAAETLVVVK